MLFCIRHSTMPFVHKHLLRILNHSINACIVGKGKRRGGVSSNKQGVGNRMGIPRGRSIVRFGEFRNLVRPQFAPISIPEDPSYWIG